MTKYTIKDITTEAELKRLYNREAYCAEGVIDEPISYQTLADAVSHWKDAKKDNITIYRCKGSFINKVYHLTGSNKYNDKLTFVFIDWQEFERTFEAHKHKGNFRYFSDVVDNNARREILKHNEFYKNYHSLYGDDWFNKSIREADPDFKW